MFVKDEELMPSEAIGRAARKTSNFCAIRRRRTSFGRGAKVAERSRNTDVERAAFFQAARCIASKSFNDET
jgi:hypothetical protein